MITFEINKEKDELEIHFDNEGINEFKNMLDLVSKNKDHIHLMTPSWGGDELSEDKQNLEFNLLNKVSLFIWDDD